MIRSAVSPQSTVRDAVRSADLAEVIRQAPAPCRLIIPSSAHRARVLRAWVQERPGTDLPEVTTMQGFVTSLARRLRTEGTLIADDEADVLLQLALQHAEERFRPSGLSVQRLVRWKQEGHTVAGVAALLSDPEALDEQGIRDVQRIARVWAAYEAVKGAGHRDRGDLFQDVCIRVEKGEVAPDVPTLMLATHGLTAIDERIVVGLSRSGWDIGVQFAERLPTLPKDRSAEVAGRLLQHGWEEIAIDARRPAAVALYESPTPREEIRRILGAVKEVVRAGTSPREIAIVLPSSGPYDDLLRDLARQSGVPLDRTDARSLSTSGDASALYAACQVVIRRWEREGIARLSLSGQVRADIPLSSLNEAADQFRVQGGSGPAGWRDRLQTSLRTLTELTDAGADEEDRSIRRTLAVLHAALRALDALESVLTPPSNLMSAATFESYLCANLIDGLMIEATPELREAISWYRQICERHDLGPQSLAEHCSRWWSIVRGRTRSEGISSGGVAVLSTADARLGGYQSVFAPGFIDGVFPDGRRDVVDEFFLGDTEGVVDAEGLQDILFSAHSAGTVDDTLASVFWDDLRSWVDEGFVDRADINPEVFAKADHPILLNRSEQRAWVDGARLDGVSRQYGLHPAVVPQEIRDDLDAAASIALGPSRIDQAQACPYRYYGERLLRLEQAVELDELMSALERGNLMHRVAQRFMRDRQTHTLGDPITLGDIEKAQVHLEAYAVDQILPSLITTFQQERERFPRGYLYDGAEERTFLDHGHRAGLLRRWLTREIATQRSDGFFPILFELEIDQEVSITADRREPIKIRVDRVDARVSGSTVEVRVIDYKTRNTPSKDDILDGASTQMPLYMAAVEAWFADRQLPVTMIDAAYHTFGKSLFAEKDPTVSTALSRCHEVSTTIEIDGKKTKQVDTVDELERALPEVLKGIDVIRGRAFEVSPLDGACQYCPLNEVCRIEDWGDVPRSGTEGME